jgi:hypothetical protein
MKDWFVKKSLHLRAVHNSAFACRLQTLRGLTKYFLRANAAARFPIPPGGESREYERSAHEARSCENVK